MSQFPIDESLVERADYAYNPRPRKDVMQDQDGKLTVDAGLVERMLDAWEHAPQTANGIEAMAAALRVAKVGLDAKWEAAIRKELAITSGRPWVFSLPHVDTIISHVRARLLTPAKSAEDRVTVCYKPHGHGADARPFKVLLDGDFTGECFGSHDPAQIYRLGLIATLKQDGK